MQRGLLLNVVVCESTAVLELLPRENEALLVRRDPLLVLQDGWRSDSNGLKEINRIFSHVRGGGRQPGFWT